LKIWGVRPEGSEGSALKIQKLLSAGKHGLCLVSPGEV